MSRKGYTSQIVHHLKRAGRPCTTLELANFIGISRKEVNPTLYRMEKEKLIYKVRQTPPLWKLGSQGNMHNIGNRPPRGRGRGRGRGVAMGMSHPGSMTRSTPSFPESRYSHSSPTHSGGIGMKSENETQTKLLDALRGCKRPQTALELAHMIGLTTRKQVNPDLYAMEKRGLVTYDDSQGPPPRWSLAKSQLIISSPPSFHGSTSGSQVVFQSSTIASSQPGFHSNLSVAQSSTQSIASSSVEMLEDADTVAQDIEDMNITDPANDQESPLASANFDLSHIPEDNIAERLLAVMEATPKIERTDLELAKCICSSQRNYSRADVRPVLETLASEKRVRKIQEFPAKWCFLTPPFPPALPHTPTTYSPSSSPKKGGGAGTGMGSFTAATAINDMNRNPVSLLSEYCQAKKLDLTFAEVREFGPPHRKHFVIAAQFGGESFEAESTSKKEAKRMAADLALQAINVFQVDSNTIMSHTQQPSHPMQPATFFDRVAQLSHDFHAKLQSSVDVAQPGRKVIAAFVLEDVNTTHCQVVSMGSGTRCITGDHMSLEGLVVNDSHAEVVARRSLLRFFYNQLISFHQRSSSSMENIFERSKKNPNFVCVKENIRFHLYISTAPCGDGAQFSRGDELNRDPPIDGTHKPTMNTKAQGVLRTKMEGGEGTIPISDETRPQTWDGIMQGGRLRTMSCSDKVGRWNVLGLQGSLLSHFMEPVYMASLTLGSLHHHGHLARAVCCRFGELEKESGILPLGFQVNHPSLGRVLGGDEMKRHTEKTSNYSVNWALGDEKGELNDGGVGWPVLPASVPKSQQAMMCSRISKASLFVHFVNLARVTNRTELLGVRSYKEAKEKAAGYQQAKMVLYKLCESKGYGMWMKKPVEQEQFDMSVLVKLGLTS